MSADLFVRELADDWRKRAQDLEDLGLSQPAALMRNCADDLEEKRAETLNRRLKLKEAARLSGLHYDTIRKRVGSEIPNAGKPGEPRIRLCDLPQIKPSEVVDETELGDETVLNRRKVG